MSGSSLYDVLGVSISATCNEIKAAYRSLARVCHPDVVAVNKRKNSASEFMRINQAYLTLSDPEKRATYDRELCRCTAKELGAVASSMAAASAAAASSHLSGFTRKKWESDQCW
ncbi:hypothetical protein SAY86_010018 [Trapa natans]|uniref:J domain-containing protein n=1 Tax=Trapa natans TaxID=22666 RepID=A0AAN7QTK3_TRANT|nr:hypothetical protein SAY86_010018 [Trapa natans]